MTFFTKEFEKTDIPEGAKFLDHFFQKQLNPLIFADRIDSRLQEAVEVAIQNAISAALDLSLYTKEAEEKIVPYLRYIFSSNFSCIN